MTANKHESLESTVSALAEICPPVIAQPPAYPFVGTKAVKRVLESDATFRLLTISLMWHLQTASEQAKRDTETLNKAGFMSSDAFVGSKLAEKLAAGVVLEGDELARADKIATKYSRQVCAQLRRVAMVADAKLASYAGTFSIRT